ncbi:Ail/Lom family outer membrane beta-barrel protein [Candidatus Symbiopectobacterium endolongispinus]|nr:Ail/Lom family outer membrane beta-barrel protein [Candidatus Symbiopectobacterium sp. PLON1]MBG6249351.1 autotransporter outer membrane beta-barrel domain-containing protein [Candidatus Symbiopectobacterium sp. PLON1]MBT9428625.1 Ail/Lom family outer membrane beta-barrel protein [Candidatus Symbiopectobacterium endolongispinus]
MNKKLLALSVVLAAISGCVIAKADTHTLSLGYSQGKVTDFKNLRGVTAKYHYQPDGSLGFISSLTYMGGSKNFDINGYKGNAPIKYYSLLVGPSYHVNEFVSLYGLVGAAHGKAKGSVTNHAGDYDSGKGNDTVFAYGAGVQIVPAANWSIDVGYEGSKFKAVKINGFNIGLGYRF